MLSSVPSLKSSLFEREMSNWYSTSNLLGRQNAQFPRALFCLELCTSVLNNKIVSINTNYLKDLVVCVMEYFKHIKLGKIILNSGLPII